jgi:hypothetical protein
MLFRAIHLSPQGHQFALSACRNISIAVHKGTPSLKHKLSCTLKKPDDKIRVVRARRKTGMIL